MGDFMRGSMNPPAQPPAVVDGGGNPPPPSCIIDRVAYITDVTNASTAWCNATDNYNGRGVTIQVTFVVADPPQVSYLCAHCIGSQFDYEPVLVATEGRLALLAIEVGQFSSNRGRDYYIYHAGDASRGIRPLLRRLPKPDPVPHDLHRFYDGFHLGLLLRPCPRPQPQPQGGIFLRPHGGYCAEEEGGIFLRPHGGYRAEEEEEEGHVSYVVAGLFGKQKPSATAHLFDLYLYSSDTKKWSIQELPLSLDQQQQGGGFEYEEYATHKAISIGGEHGSMCFVDLRQGIFQCNLLDSTPVLHYYPMPPPLEPNPVRVHTCPQASRDVAVVDGGRRIKFVQLHLQVTMHRHGGVWGRVVPSYDGWKAATWSMDTARPSSGWRQDSEVIHASEVGCTIDPALLQLPPYEFDDDQGLPLPQTFEKHHTSLPVICLHNDGKDVVYFMTKVNYYHKPALVIAVDMSNKTAQQITQFLPGKLIASAFVHSRISKFLSMAPAPAPGTRGNLKRPGMTALTACSYRKQHCVDGTELGKTVEEHQGSMEGLEPCTASMEGRMRTLSAHDAQREYVIRAKYPMEGLEPCTASMEGRMRTLSAHDAQREYVIPAKYPTLRLDVPIGGLESELRLSMETSKRSARDISDDLASLPTDEDRHKFLEEHKKLLNR